MSTKPTSASYNIKKSAHIAFQSRIASFHLPLRFIASKIRKTLGSWFVIIVLGTLKYVARPLTDKNLSMKGNWDHDFQAHGYTSQFHTEYTQFTVRCTGSEKIVQRHSLRRVSIDFT